MRIALTGNPNSGKTTMYNALTGSNEKVGNWAGVTGCLLYTSLCNVHTPTISFQRFICFYSTTTICKCQSFYEIFYTKNM